MDQDKQRKSQRSHRVVISTENRDEVSLFDILLSLRRQWKLICSVVVVITLAVFMVILQMPKVYRAEVVLLPPKTSEVALFNIPDLYANSTSEENLYLYSTTSGDLYAAMVQNLRSNSLRYQFFLEHNLYDILKSKENPAETKYVVFQNKFNDLMQVKDGGVKKESLEYVSITLDGPRQDLVAQWLNDFVDFVDTYTILEVINTIKAKVRVKKLGLQEQISSLRATARHKREDEIKRLAEALEIARKIRPDATGSQAGDGGGAVFTAGESPAGEYTKGIKVLEAEIAALNKRKSDDPYIAGLSGVQEQLIFWQNLTIQKDDVHAARVDKQAVDENNIVKPKAKLMLALAFVLGVIMALLIAVVRCLVVKQRLASENDSGFCSS